MSNALPQIEKPTITNYYQVMILHYLRHSPMESLTFQQLKNKLSMTDGNLAGCLRILERESCVDVQKGFVGRKTCTYVHLSATGEMRLHDFKVAFKELFV